MHPNRRDFIKSGFATAAVLIRGNTLNAQSPLAAPTAAASPLFLDATTPKRGAAGEPFRFGTARRPDGRELLADRRSLLLDGRPWLPVMGEFHYSRYPAAEWRDELLKMKAGGIDIVATYVFWIHHEEIENSFDWSERRSLRAFVECCREIGLLAVVRCGPWCHGEVRNGGLPDWILRQDLRVRSDDPRYLARVRRLYGEIARQLGGLLWKDGGPVIGIQLENEYGGPAEHLLALKAIAQQAGLDVPLYTRTGWPALSNPMPVGQILPLFGAYAEGFWDRVLTPMPGEYGEAFVFKLARTDAAIATDQLGRREARDGDDVGGHPYFCCELGGGMASSYHRRIRVDPADIDAVALVKLGSGNNLQGYYMYHGGTNPQGRLTTLQESQATNYWNDVPVMGYDFRAPLGEFGQRRPHYDLLRRTHLFLRDHGPMLATWPACLPEVRPSSARDTATLRWCARSDGRSGLLFVNNHQRLQPMPAKLGVQFEVRLSDGSIRVPDAPIDIPAGCRFFWPFHLQLAGATLRYATAQPICTLQDGTTTYAVFAEIPGIASEFVFAAGSSRVLDTTGSVTTNTSTIRIQRPTPGTTPAIRLRTPKGTLAILLLSHDDSLRCWKEELLGQQRLFLTAAGLIVDGRRLRLYADDVSDLAVSILPAPASVTREGRQQNGTPNGVFTSFATQTPRPMRPSVSVEAVRPAGPLRPIRKGSQGVAEAPSDSDFAQAAVWRLRLPAGIDVARDLLLRLRYTGDVARLSLGGRLLSDDFYDGSPFDLGLTRYAPDIYRDELLLAILPLQQEVPIYISDGRPDFGGAASLARLDAVEVVERHHVVLDVA
jgi:beta-galactosidase